MESHRLNSCSFPCTLRSAIPPRKSTAARRRPTPYLTGGEVREGYKTPSLAPHLRRHLSSLTAAAAPSLRGTRLCEDRILSPLPTSASYAPPPLILLATDREPYAGTLERALDRQGYTVFRVHTDRLALEAARSAHPALIILDEALPGADLATLCHALRDDPDVGSSTPVLLVTTRRPGAADHLDALRDGVWEFVVEPLPDEELTARLQSYLAARVETSRHATPLVDAATGLASLQGLTRRARELTLQAFNHYAPLACVALAPAPGSAADAAALLAETLRAIGRRSDAIGALGPPHGGFLVVAPGTGGSGAVKLAERIPRPRQATAARPRRPAPTLRAGYDPVDNVRYAPLEPRDLLGHATTALRAGGMSWIRRYGER